MAKHFVSILAAEMGAFIRFKRNLGKPYIGGFHILCSFDSYVAEHHRGHGPIDWKGLVHGWLIRLPERKRGTVNCDFSASGIVRPIKD